MYPDFRLKSFQKFDATRSTMNERLRFFVNGFYVGSIPTHKTKKQTFKKKTKIKIMKNLEELKQTESNLLHCIEEGYAMLYEENSHQVRSYISNLQSELMDVQAEIRNFKNNQ